MALCGCWQRMGTLAVAAPPGNTGFPVGKFDVEIVSRDREGGKKLSERRVRVSQLGTPKL